MALKHAELTSAIISAFYTVYNTLGYGFLEKVYENAFVCELTQRGFPVKQQAKINVYYGDVVVGEYFADLLVDGKVIVELKAAEAIHESHTAQLTNYLKATNCEIGFVFNFGPEPTFKRRVYENRRKNPRRSA